jgi:hypothetical protein
VNSREKKRVVDDLCKPLPSLGRRIVEASKILDVCLQAAQRQTVGHTEKMPIHYQASVMVPAGPQSPRSALALYDARSHSRWESSLRGKSAVKTRNGN